MQVMYKRTYPKTFDELVAGIRRAKEDILPEPIPDERQDEIGIIAAR